MSDATDERRARAIWQEESQRAAGRPRRITWEQEGESEKARFRGYAAATRASDAEAGMVLVPRKLTAPARHAMDDANSADRDEYWDAVWDAAIAAHEGDW